MTMGSIAQDTMGKITQYHSGEMASLLGLDHSPAPRIEVGSERFSALLQLGQNPHQWGRRETWPGNGSE
ncbi:MAG: hypothetical protein H5T63_10350 [Chloroflexi bacterium]|nr:hypothetical protein [Chloroflexota bacterium]